MVGAVGIELRVCRMECYDRRIPAFGHYQFVIVDVPLNTVRTA